MVEATDRFVYIKDGETYLKISLEVTLYWRGSVFDKSDGVIHFYRRALKEIQGRLKYYETGNMSGAKPLKKDTLEMVPNWFQNAKREPDIYMMNLESGEKQNEPSDCNIFVLADDDDEEPVGLIRISLPISFIEESAEPFVKLMQELTSDLDFESGHAGFGVNWDSRGEMAIEAMETMFHLSSRFLGIDFPEFDVTLVSMRKTKPSGIKCVNWLTFLGKELSTRVGTLESIRNQLGNDCTVYSMPNGTLIRAGEKPGLGDLNRNEKLPLYHRVGKIMAPYRFVDHRQIFGSSLGGGRDATTKWLGRFDL